MNSREYDVTYITIIYITPFPLIWLKLRTNKPNVATLCYGNRVKQDNDTRWHTYCPVPQLAAVVCLNPEDTHISKSAQLQLQDYMADAIPLFFFFFVSKAQSLPVLQRRVFIDSLQLTTSIWKTKKCAIKRTKPTWRKTMSTLLLLLCSGGRRVYKRHSDWSIARWRGRVSHAHKTL